MSEKPLATPRGSHADNENSRLECQTGTTAHTEPKGQFGEVSNLVIREVAAERKRQIEQEGWDAEHDDEHTDGEMACAAVCYVMGRTRFGDSYGPEELWPRQWDYSWWKPRAYRRNLVKAAALIVAEIERLDRATQQ